MPFQLKNGFIGTLYFQIAEETCISFRLENVFQAYFCGSCLLLGLHPEIPTYFINTWRQFCPSERLWFLKSLAFYQGKSKSSLVTYKKDTALCPSWDYLRNTRLVQQFLKHVNVIYPF